MPDLQKKKSRYQQVCQILNKAAGDSSADYQGYGKFWELPLAEFLTVTIYGIPMIAPERTGGDCKTFEGDSTAIAPAAKENCCCTPASPVLPAVKQPGRGASSGLIKALSGQAPFDGQQFPPFMWGGGPVNASDIQFISDWIDDGCPATDDSDAAVVSNSKSALLANIHLGKESCATSSRPVNTIKAEAGQLKQRKNVECLTEDELCKFRMAMAFLQKLSTDFPLDKRSYDNFARLHGNECQHGWELFLPWHRMMLYEFEKQLQDQIPDVTLPYWDWPLALYNNGINPKPKDVKLPKSVKTPIPDKYISGIIPSAYRCWLNQAAIDRLVKAGVPQTIKNIQDFTYNSGVEFFWVVEQILGTQSTASFRSLILAELKLVNPLWHEFRYPAMFYDPSTGEAQEFGGLTSQFHHHYPTQDDLEEMLQVNNWRDFGGGPVFDESFGVLDQEPHNTIHLWVGGENLFNYDGHDSNPANPPVGSMLSNLTAGFDPVFYAHHTNCDRLFAQWQQRWPGQTAFDPNALLPGLNYSVASSWSTQKLGYEYVMDSKYFETDSSAGFKMLKSAKAGLNAIAFANHFKAVLTLHKVAPPNRSFTVRVFVNLPDANENTPVDNNDHFAGHISLFGHGECIGGPGHCAVPGEIQKFDFRQKQHSRPGNYRMDITKTVLNMKEKGHKDIEIKLVTINSGNLTTRETLKMEGLSINLH